VLTGQGRLVLGELSGADRDGADDRAAARCMVLALAMGLGLGSTTDDQAAVSC
jgi:hypothetical protein